MANGTLNELTLIGHLGKDKKLTSLNGGGEVFSVSVATDEGYKNRQTGERVERTEWTKIEAFGKLATIMNDGLKKGSKIWVRGAKLTDTSEKDGVTRYFVTLRVDVFKFLDGKQEGETYAADNSQPSQSPAQELGYCFADGTPLSPADMAPYKGKQPKWPVGQNPPPYPAA